MGNNLFQTVNYRKCNNPECNYSGQALSFITKSEVASQEANWACMNNSLHCPKCGSTDLSGYYHDAELTDPVKEPEVILPNNTNPPHPIPTDKPAMVKHTNGYVFYNYIPNRRVGVIDLPKEIIDNLPPSFTKEKRILIDFLRDDLSLEDVSYIGSSNLIAGRLKNTQLNISEITGIALMQVLQKYFTAKEPAPVSESEK